jgi:hypothetical protein
VVGEGNMHNYNFKLIVKFKVLFLVISISSMVFLHGQKAYSSEVDLPKNITKDDLIKYHKAVEDFIFTKKKKGGIEVYTGLREKSACIIEFFGNNDALTKINYFFYWVREKEINKKNFLIMVSLANQIDSNSVKWVSESFPDAAPYVNQGKNYESKKLFGKNIFIFKFLTEMEKKKKIMTVHLTIQPAD